jgi:AP2 domain
LGGGTGQDHNKYGPLGLSSIWGPLHRNATPLQNIRNRGKFTQGSSIYKGVDLHKPTGSWRARIKATERQINLGYFKTQEEAAIAYNQAALKYHGEFAQLNMLEAA